MAYIDPSAAAAGEDGAAGSGTKSNGGETVSPAPSPTPSPTHPSCIFCAFPAENNDAARLILLRGETCFVILNAYPYNNGHLMVVPYRHVSRPADLFAAEQAELFGLAARMTTVLDGVSRPDGYNLGMNVGSAAGAGIADHLHLHIVPRWNGDTNFMPVVGEVKVMPESLDQVYAKLSAALSATAAAATNE